MRPVKLLHTADVHLGLSAAGLDGLEERSFEAAIDLGLDLDVDALLIAGDLFDHARVSDDLLEWTAKQLDRLNKPVVLLVGNHDPLDRESVHLRFGAAERCEQVLFLDNPAGSTVELPDLELVVWGRAMEEHAPSFRPLEGIPAKPEGRWAVVAGHGVTMAHDRPTHHGSPIAPAEIDAVDWDYIALGHHHGHKVVRDAPVPAIYPGAIARSSHGQPGVVVVDFVPGGGAMWAWQGLAV
jgi:DNA repair exonuclease SbcCD nuclease subunit